MSCFFVFGGMLRHVFVVLFFEEAVLVGFWVIFVIVCCFFERKHVRHCLVREKFFFK